MDVKAHMAKLHKPFTRTELAYYKNVGDFSVGAKERAQVDSDRAEEIFTYAILDMAGRKPLRTAKQFKNAAEYEYYKAAIYVNATDEENQL